MRSDLVELRRDSWLDPKVIGSKVIDDIVLYRDPCRVRFSQTSGHVPVRQALLGSNLNAVLTVYCHF
jgi:hypothetical protein